MKSFLTIILILIVAFAFIWAAKTDKLFKSASFEGVYAGSSESFNQSVIRILELKENGQAVLKSDLKEKGVLKDTGTWQSSGSVVVFKITGSDYRFKGLPDQIEFAKSRAGLTAVFYDEKIYGRGSLDFYKFWPEDKEKSSQRLAASGNRDLSLEAVLATLLKGRWKISYESSRDANGQSIKTPITGVLANVDFKYNYLTGQICNEFSGSYSLASNVVVGNEIISTKKACDNPDMQIENNFFSGLRSGLFVNFDKSGNGISLVDMTPGSGRWFYLSRQ